MLDDTSIHIYKVQGPVRSGVGIHRAEIGVRGGNEFQLLLFQPVMQGDQPFVVFDVRATNHAPHGFANPIGTLHVIPEPVTPENGLAASAGKTLKGSIVRSSQSATSLQIRCSLYRPSGRIPLSQPYPFEQISILVRKRKITEILPRKDRRQTRLTIFGCDAFPPVIRRLPPLSGKD